VGDGFPRQALASRYDVTDLKEDEWHEHCGRTTKSLLQRWLPAPSSNCKSMLNAGAGIYDIAAPGYDQYHLDLFTTPLEGRSRAVCGRIEQMPFCATCFDVVVCVGEVLSYCDPSRAFAEFNRCLRKGGLLIFDYPSSRSPRHWLADRFGRAADLFRDHYNHTDEPIWIYSPAYIEELLGNTGFQGRARGGTHTLSAIARRLRLPFATASRLEQRLPFLGRLTFVADVITVAARKVSP
jgi:SAM-dependent methyltransferase